MTPLLVNNGLLLLDQLNVFLDGICFSLGTIAKLLDVLKAGFLCLQQLVQLPLLLRILIAGLGQRRQHVSRSLVDGLLHLGVDVVLVCETLLHIDFMYLRLVAFGNG